MIDDPARDSADPAKSGVPGARFRKQRLRRIRAYQRQELAAMDALTAIFGAAIGDMLHINLLQGEHIKRTLARSTLPFDDHSTLAKEVDLFAKTAKQAERYAQLQLRLRSDDGSGSTPRRRRAPPADSGNGDGGGLGS